MGPYDEIELKEMLKVFNELAPGGKEDYDYTYKYIYEPALKAVKDYENNPIEDKMSLYRYILGLYDIGEVDKYMITTKRFIELYGGTGYHHYARGVILINHYHDPKGIDEIYKAIEISPKFMDQLEVIGYASIRLGLQDKLDEFKVKMIDMVEHAFEIGLYTTKNRRKLVSVEPFIYEEPIMNYLLDVIQGDNLAYSAFLFKETFADGFQQHHLILTANIEDQDRFYLGIQKVKMALSLDNEMFQLDTHLSKYYFQKLYKKVQPFYTKE
jgi:tetratricopeptide (TPR) repeat protein